MPVARISLYFQCLLPVFLCIFSALCQYFFVFSVPYASISLYFQCLLPVFLCIFSALCQYFFAFLGPVSGIFCIFSACCWYFFVLPGPDASISLYFQWVMPVFLCILRAWCSFMYICVYITEPDTNLLCLYVYFCIYFRV